MRRAVSARRRRRSDVADPCPHCAAEIARLRAVADAAREWLTARDAVRTCDERPSGRFDLALERAGEARDRLRQAVAALDEEGVGDGD
jgi:hypothetical protein